MGEQIECSRRPVAVTAIVAPRRRFLSPGVFVLMLMMLISGPLSLAHATIHHVSMPGLQDKLSNEQNYAGVGVVDTADNLSLGQGGQPPLPEQALLEQHCVVCQWLQGAPLRAADSSERRAPANVAYSAPFARQAAEFTPPPLQRPPRF